MVIRRYRMGSSDGSVNASIADLDTLNITRPGTVIGILLTTMLDSITDNVRVLTSVSRFAINDWTSIAAFNGAQTQTLAELGVTGNFVTSGLAQKDCTVWVPCKDKVKIGDMLSMHCHVTGTVVCYLSALVVVEEGES